MRQNAPQWSAAVDQRGFLQLDRQIEERLAQDHHHERHDEGGVHQDQCEVGVEQAEERITR